MKALDVSIHTRKDSIYVGEANQIVKTMTLTESHPMVDLLDFGPEGFIGNFDTSLSLDEVRIDNTNNVRDRNLIPVHSADSQAVRSDKRENDVPSPNFSKMSSNCFLGSSPASSLPSSSVLPSLVAESTNDGTTRSAINDGRTMGLSFNGCSDDQGVEAHSPGQGDERHQGLEPHESHRAPEALCAGRIRLNGDDRGSQEAPPSWMAAVNPSGIQSGCSDAGDQGEGNDGLLFYDCEEQDNDLLWKGH